MPQADVGLGHRLPRQRLANPRIDELRKRLDKEPGSRLFAQLAEELRKDGQLPEAIAVSRAGLARHPTYASARMTLGRALFDSGELAAARAEFEAVLKAAPDNILASRLLAESLEGGGDLSAAATQYEATLKLSPGDRSLVARLEDLRRRPGTEPGPAASLAAPSPAPAPGAGGEPPPIPLVDADETFEIERPSEAPTAFRRQESAPAVTPSVYGQETDDGDGPGFEVVHSSSETVRLPAPEKQKAGPPAERAPEPPALVPPAAPAPPAAFAQNAYYRASTSVSATWDDAVLIPEPADDEVEAPPPVALPEPELPPAIDSSLPTLPEAPPTRAANVPPPVAVVPPPPSAPPPAAEILSPTLAELYYSQGFIDKATDVYRKMIAAGQGGPKVHSRLAELEAAKVPATAVRGAERRAAIEQTIVRLERFLAAVRRG